MPLTNETRVRVEGRSKMRATTRSASSVRPAVRLRPSAGRPGRGSPRPTPGEWWRSVSSDRPARSGCGVKEAQDTAAKCNRAAAALRTARDAVRGRLYRRARCTPRRPSRYPGPVSERDGARAEQAAAQRRSILLAAAIVAPDAPGRGGVYDRLAALRAAARARHPARRAARHGRRRPPARAWRCALASGRPGADGAAMAIGLGAFALTGAAVGGGPPRAGARRPAHREPVAHGPPHGRPQLRLLRRRAAARVPARRALRPRAVARAARPRPLQGVQRPLGPRRGQPPARRRWARPSGTARARPTSRPASAARSSR